MDRGDLNHLVRSITPVVVVLSIQRVKSPSLPLPPYLKVTPQRVMIIKKIDH